MIQVTIFGILQVRATRHAPDANYRKGRGRPSHGVFIRSTGVTTHRIAYEFAGGDSVETIFSRRAGIVTRDEVEAALRFEMYSREKRVAVVRRLM